MKAVPQEIMHFLIPIDGNIEQLLLLCPGSRFRAIGDRRIAGDDVLEVGAHGLVEGEPVIRECGLDEGPKCVCGVRDPAELVAESLEGF